MFSIRTCVAGGLRVWTARRQIQSAHKRNPKMQHILHLIWFGGNPDNCLCAFHHVFDSRAGYFFVVPSHPSKTMKCVFGYVLRIPTRNSDPVTTSILVDRLLRNKIFHGEPKVSRRLCQQANWLELLSPLKLLMSKPRLRQRKSSIDPPKIRILIIGTSKKVPVVLFLSLTA